MPFSLKPMAIIATCEWLKFSFTIVFNLLYFFTERKSHFLNSLLEFKRETAKKSFCRFMQLADHVVRTLQHKICLGKKFKCIKPRPHDQIMKAMQYGS